MLCSEPGAFSAPPGAGAGAGAGPRGVPERGASALAGVPGARRRVPGRGGARPLPGTRCRERLSFFSVRNCSGHHKVHYCIEVHIIHYPVSAGECPRLGLLFWSQLFWIPQLREVVGRDHAAMA